MCKRLGEKRIMPVIISQEFNCTNCGKDLNNIELTYGTAVICPDCGRVHTIRVKPVTSYGALCGQNLTVYLESHHGTFGVVPGWTVGGVPCTVGTDGKPI